MVEGTVRKVLPVGDPRLRNPAAAVGDPRLPEVREAARDLVATLGDFRRRHGFGRGIAAPQVGVPLRMIALDLGEGPFVAFDPEIVSRGETTFTLWDDCMCFPWLLVRVRRHERISVRYLDEEGRQRGWRELPRDRSELLQHEVDHLDGVLALDRAQAPAGGSRTEGVLDAIVAREAFDADPARFRACVDYVIGD